MIENLQEELYQLANKQTNKQKVLNFVLTFKKCADG